MDNIKQIGIRFTKDEYDKLKKLAEERKFKSVTQMVRLDTQKNYKMGVFSHYDC